ncbi:MAG: primosomal protein N' [Betaproteobacteria bacterium]
MERQVESSNLSKFADPGGGLTADLPQAILRVALALPLHRLFDYRWEGAAEVRRGMLVQVPFGSGERIGIVLEVLPVGELPASQLKAARGLVEDLPPLTDDFLTLCQFAAQYYQAPLGDVMLKALPAGLKRLSPVKRRQIRSVRRNQGESAPELNAEQATTLAAMRELSGFSVSLLHGVTGSGKTEVYLRLIEKVAERGKQTLLLVPEINLTPQLEMRVRSRFPNTTVVTLHSELAEAARERDWRLAFNGEAGIVLGTRLAVFTPMPHLGLIIIDEEHDPSFKQQDGVRYSARDLAVVRASQQGVPIILGSATPSLESWANASTGRYRLFSLATRAHREAKLPAVRILDTRRLVLQEGIAAPLLEAIEERLARGEQSLVFLNRRGYAPVLACQACGWISHCRRCAANLVLHLADRRLRCHHCGFEERIPHACPTCGNQDVQPFGRGTQRLEAWLHERFPNARILRVDRDSAKSRKQWEAMLERIHGGEADILVGTQMLAKGHDFPRLTLVGALGADAALFAADWRSPERLFAQLMQVAGRAGRAERPGEVLIQTQYPEHPLYRALVGHDFPGFAAALLREREQAGFPPFTHQAVLRAEAKDMKPALDFLSAAAALPAVSLNRGIAIYDPVPMRLSRRANLERAQLLVESRSRPELQRFLPAWRAEIDEIRAPGGLRWHLEVDPIEF